MSIAKISSAEIDAIAIADMLGTAIARLDIYGPKVRAMVREYFEHNNGHGTFGDEHAKAVIAFIDAIGKADAS